MEAVGNSQQGCVPDSLGRADFIGKPKTSVPTAVAHIAIVLVTIGVGGSGGRSIPTQRNQAGCCQGDQRKLFPMR